MTHPTPRRMTPRTLCPAMLCLRLSCWAEHACPYMGSLDSEQLGAAAQGKCLHNTWSQWDGWYNAAKGGSQGKSAWAGKLWLVLRVCLQLQRPPLKNPAHVPYPKPPAFYSFKIKPWSWGCFWLFWQLILRVFFGVSEMLSGQEISLSLRLQF